MVPGRDISEFVQVNIPSHLLLGGFLTTVLERRMNPEISFDSEALDRLDPVRLRSMAGALRQGGLTVTLHAPFMDMAPGSPDSMVRAVVRHRLEQVLEVAEIFRPVSVVCHAAYEERRYRHMKAEWLENSAGLWRWFSSALGEFDGRLVLENVFEGHPEELKDLFEELSAQDIRFCLDVGHQSAFSSSTLARWLEVLGPYIGQLHLHDNMGRSDDHLAIGKGTVNFPLLFSWLSANCPRPPIVTIEPHIREEVELSLSALEKLWPW